MKLEIGSGNMPTKGYKHLDINANAPDVDYVGDIRALITEDYDIEKYPNLKFISNETFEEIKAYHFIEHIQWIYQEALFRLFYQWLLPGGRLNLQTPDLEWIVQSYLHRKKKSWLTLKNKQYVFPDKEHPQLTDSGNPIQFHQWVNYKIFSGCSPGDFHHCLYDAESLERTLEKIGYQSINVRSKHATLIAMAEKACEKEKHREYYEG